MTATTDAPTATESTSLLQRSRSSEIASVPKPLPHYRRTICAIAILVVALEIGDRLQEAPWFRLLESLICEKYYDGQDSISFGGGPVPERLCKINPIQDELATLTGINMALSFVPSLLLTVPFGILAEKRGRKFILCLSLLGIVLQTACLQLTALLAAKQVIHYSWFLVANAFLFIGGGSAVISSTLYVMLTDITPTAQLSNAYFVLLSATLVPTVISVPLAAFMMRTSAWRPMIIGNLIIIFSAAIALVLPETLPSRRQEPPIDMFPSEADADADAEYTSQHSNHPRQTIRGWVRARLDSYAFLTSSPLLLALAPTFVINQLGPVCMRFMLPMVSKRFEWEISKASYLMPVASTATLVLLILILPFITTQLIKTFGLAPNTVNLGIARASIVLHIAGFVGIALSANVPVIVVSIVIYSFGAGFSPAVRSIATSVTPADCVSKLFAACQTFSTIGGIISGPILSKAYVLGLGWGGLWSGLPFLASGALYAFAGIIIMLIRLPRQPKDDDDLPDTDEADAQRH